MPLRLPILGTPNPRSKNWEIWGFDPNRFSISMVEFPPDDKGNSPNCLTQDAWLCGFLLHASGVSRTRHSSLECCFRPLRICLAGFGGARTPVSGFGEYHSQVLLQACVGHGCRLLSGYNIYSISSDSGHRRTSRRIDCERLVSLRRVSLGSAPEPDRYGQSPC